MMKMMPVPAAALPQCLLLTALALATLTLSGAQRHTVPFDFGWRVRRAPRPACNYPHALPGILQGGGSGQGWLVQNVSSAIACQAAACAANAQAWSFCASNCGGEGRDPWLHHPRGVVNNPPHCVLGNVGQVYPYLTNWTSQARAVNAGLGPSRPDEVQLSYDDSSWELIDLPHDASITLDYNQQAPHGEAYIQATETLYRKHFSLPKRFEGRAITLEVDGALMFSRWWVNGVQVVALKTDGYLPLALRLDTANVSLNYGTTKDNIIAVWVDNGASTGWWYEGSGLTRNARLVVASHVAQFKPFAIAAPSTVVAGSMSPHGSNPVHGLMGSATVFPSADVSIGKVTGAGTRLLISFELVDTNGRLVGDTQAAWTTSAANSSSTVSAPPITVHKAELWSVARPYLYILIATLKVYGDSVTVLDSVNTTVGIRSVEWNPTHGLYLNEQHTKMRGFCNHESFTGVGAAISPRIELFRLQQMRGLGGNSWRTSHNPPRPALLEMADRLGVMILDENRVFATTSNCPGDFTDVNHTCARGNVPDDPGNVTAQVERLALRDRNHASVLWYSLCNEFGCGPGTLLKNNTAQKCYDAMHAVDRSRAITGNMGWQTSSTADVSSGTPISILFDVMGVSHQQLSVFDAWHKAEPSKLIVATECCSCTTQRGEDTDLLPARSSTTAPFVYNSNENSDCVSEQTQRSNQLSFVGGTFVWTCHDYLGEPSRNSQGQVWPHVSSSFGSFDLAGFPKAPVWWYRSWWLAAVSDKDAGRPPLATSKTATFCRLVESWQPSLFSSGRNLTVYTNAAAVQIYVNDEAASDVVYMSPFGAAKFASVQYASGRVTARCMSASGAVLAMHTKNSFSKPVAIKLSVDAPSVRTGTGERVYLDGQDVTLVRATVVDADGFTVHTSMNNISFAVTNGPARLIGVGNGDPANQDPNHASWRPAYHGLVRAIFQVTLYAAGTAADRELIMAVNKEAGAGPLCSQVATGQQSQPTSFTVTAHSNGLLSDSLTIPLSSDESDSPLHVAEMSVPLADIGE